MQFNIISYLYHAFRHLFPLSFQMKNIGYTYRRPNKNGEYIIIQTNAFFSIDSGEWGELINEKYSCNGHSSIFSCKHYKWDAILQASQTSNSVRYVT